MESKTVEMGGRKYVLHEIPAFKAQKIAFKCFDVFKTKDLTTVSDETILQICSYISAINANGVEIPLKDEDLISINVKDSGVLMMLELNLLEYNFGFFFDGSLLKGMADVFERMTKAQDAASEAEGSLKARM